MKKRVFLGILTIIVIVSIVMTGMNFSSNQYVSTFYEENKDTLENTLNDIVKRYVEEEHFSGTVLVAEGDQILFHEGYGYARRYFGKTENTIHTKFILGSITKTFTSAAILHMVDQGLLNLNDKLGKYYPDYELWKDVSIHNLLNYSGIKNYYESIFNIMGYYMGHQTPEKIMSGMKNKILLFKPGEGYDYSNTNYTILSGLIERVSGESYIDYLRKNILDPLDLKNTGYQENPQKVENLARGYCVNMVVEVNGFNLSNFYGAGGLYSTTEDLFNFSKSLDVQKYFNDTSKVSIRPDVFYGYGVTFKKDKELGDVLFHTGGGPGISTGIYKMLDKNKTVIILNNNQSFSSFNLVKDLCLAIDNSQS